MNRRTTNQECALHFMSRPAVRAPKYSIGSQITRKIVDTNWGFLHEENNDITHRSSRVVFTSSGPPSYWILASTVYIMAGLLRMGALPRLYSRIACRQIQTSSVRQYRPVPTARPAYGSELEALQAKEKGPWSELSKQEKIDCKLR